jgi:hypothetical protein
MENPFEKKDHTILIFALAAGALVGGAIAYLSLSEQGQEAMDSIKHKVKDLAKDLAAGIISDKTGVRKRTVKKVEDHIVK